MIESATAFAPASIGNMGVGFDMLGLALDGVGDRVAARRGGDGITLVDVYGIDGRPHPTLSRDPALNTAAIAANALWEAHGDGTGVELTLHKGVPLQSGMGSSAASAVAGAVAANALLERPLPLEDVLIYALDGERFASGGVHADNVAPSLRGGMVFCPPALLPKTWSLKTPEGVSAVLVHPELHVNTAEARRALAKSVGRQQWIDQQGYLAAFLLASAKSDIGLIRETLRDIIIEPQRADSVACFADVRDAANKAGALGVSLSGSGPSVFALVETQSASNVATAMEQACRSLGIECQSWISSMKAPGARVES